MNKIVIFFLLAAAAVVLAVPGRFARRSTQRQLLVGYWGQNGAGPKFGKPNYEKPLKWFCENTKYDILILSFMHILFIGQDELPGTNFAFHCEKTVDTAHPYLLRCPKIEEGIKECQKLGKLVFISMGGATGDGTLGSPVRAKKLAHNIWNLFLGGNDPTLSKLRGFGSAVLDGVDLDIEGGSHHHYPEFVRELRMLMNSDSSRRYYITGAPQCPYPDHFLGPKAGTGLGEAGEHFDHLYIQFYNNYCHTGAGNWFDNTLKQWLDFASNRKPSGPLIFIGLPGEVGGANGAQYYRKPSELAAMYKKVRDMPGVGGIMLWDCSWDQNNVINGRYYHEYAYDLLRDGITVPPTVRPGTKPPVPPVTQAPQTTLAPQTTQAPQTAAPPVTQPPTGPIDCSSMADGLYAHETDCSKFVQCAGGSRFEKGCPPGLKFNKVHKYCDWPANVTC